jgi:hypothetical protein
LLISNTEEDWPDDCGRAEQALYVRTEVNLTQHSGGKAVLPTSPAQEATSRE